MRATTRAQSKMERQQELKSRFQSTNETKHAGVNLYIKNLDDQMDDTALRELFAPFGTVTSAKV